MQRKKLNRELEAEELVQDPYCQTYIPMGTAVRKRVEGRGSFILLSQGMSEEIS